MKWKKDFFLQNKIVISVFVLFLITAGVAVAFLNKNTANYQTVVVQGGYLRQTVDVSGSLEVLKDADLAIESSGIVEKIFVNKGDYVDKGDVILSLESDSELADVEKAAAAVQRAQASLSVAMAGASEEELSVAEANKKMAQIALENIKKTDEASIQKAQAAYEKAQDDYQAILLDNEQSIEQAKDDLLSSLSAGVITVRSVLSEADKILGIENTIINDSFEIYLAANDKQVLNDAKKSYQNAALYRDKAEDALYSLKNTDEIQEDDLSSIIDAVDAAMKASEAALYNTRLVLDATNVDADVLSSEDVNSFKTSIDSARTSLQSQQDSLIQYKQAWERIKLTAENNAQSYYNAMILARSDYEVALARYEADIANKQAALDYAVAEYNKVVAAMRDIDLEIYKADLSAAQADLAAAQANLEKKRLRAPFSGIVVDIEPTVGEMISAGEQAVSLKDIQNGYKLRVSIPESDIAKVSVQDKAEVTLDAYGDDLVMDAYVAAIDPAETIKEGVVYYLADVYLVDDSKIALRSGTSADIPD
ncbi:HlyD family efflux transporter periplasmic adaptor subunit, partial [Candidatus Parcubacteria bacterium]